MELEELKTFLRIDYDTEDAILVHLKSVAESYVLGDIEVKETEDVRFKHAVALLVGHWLANRESTTDLNLNAIPFGVESLIQQLRGLSHE
ncbi:head-tail connector protein [Enterococcus hirae]